MRTKTLALSTLLGALGSATSLVAQVNVYSINAVGYINATFPPGYSILTCPLICTPDNTLNSIFPLPASVPSGGAPLFGASVSIFSGGSFSGAGKADSVSYSGGWNAGGTITLNPGQACFFFNPNALGGANMSATFVGTVPQTGQYNMTNTLAPGYNLVGSIVPVTGSYASPILNMTNSLGSFDTFNFFDPSLVAGHTPLVQTGYQTAQGSYSHGWTGGAGVNGEPVGTNVTYGFFYYNATAGGPTGGYAETSSNELWVENFTINP
jgi:hypothetical protein